MSAVNRRIAAALVFVVCAQACTCGKKDGADAAPAPAEATVAALAASPLSLPIAAAVASDGAVWVAGFVAERHAVIAERHQGERVTQVAELDKGVDWAPDMELRVVADPSGGIAVALRVARGTERVRELRFVAADGKLTGDPVATGPALCATRASVAWSAPGGGKVSVRPWAGGAVDEIALPADREPVLSCADRQVYVLAEGDDDVLLYTAPSKGGPQKLIRDLDDERERALFTFGDDGLGVVEVAQSGAMRFTRGGAVGPFAWKKVAHTFPEDEDVVAVDGDARAVWVLVTRDATSRCSGAEAAVDVVVHRLAEAGEKELAVAKGECGRDLGPYWAGLVGEGAVLGWAERVPKKAPTDAPIGALGWARVSGDAVDAHQSPISADGLVFAGCAQEKCYAVALERAPGTDGMKPGAARVIAFP